MRRHPPWCPLFQLVPVLVLAGGYVFLREELSARQYVGCFVTIVAALFISMDRIDGRIFRPRPAFWYMLLPSTFATIALLTFKYGVTTQSFWQVLPYESLGIALCAVCLLFIPGAWSDIRREAARLPRSIILIVGIDELLYVVSRYLSYFALSLLTAGVVSTLAGLQPVFVLIFGVVLSLWFPSVLEDVLDRTDLRRKLTAVGLIVVGTALIAW